MTARTIWSSDEPSSPIVKRSRLQSHDAPSRFSWLTMVPPLSAFHAHTFSTKLLAADRAAVLLPLHHLPLDHQLRGDAGVVRARLPQHVLAAHALEAAQHVLQRVVERVPHVQRARHVGRRDDDAVGLGLGALGPAGLEGFGLHPLVVDARFDVGWLVGLLEHGGIRSQAGNSAARPNAAIREGPAARRRGREQIWLKSSAHHAVS